ncbi:MAG TPA: Rieske 2Fe-2S domain-containing protein [Acidimicrobiales bacterium]|nr:Rieske 2Fe-2S domain-containing protein [Acidimicrobiales bacterium]
MTSVPTRNLDTDGALATTSVEVSELAGGLRRALEYHWHPVCLASQLPGPVPVRLLGRDLAVARLGSGRAIAVVDRCPHRSTRLSVGTVEDDCLRCAYHGWAFAPDGHCVDIPSMPYGPIPGRARVDAFEATLAYGLVWVRLDGAAETVVPACPAFEDTTMKVLVGEPYTWPVAAPRRVENFVDLAHFAFVHDGSLGRRDRPVPPIPDITRVDGELRFAYDPTTSPSGPGIEVTGGLWVGSWCQAVWRLRWRVSIWRGVRPRM